MVDYIILNTQLSKQSIENTIQLLEEDCTIPFISRYRKERTKGLDEVQIGEIVKFKDQYEVLEKRKKHILKALETQSALTAALKEKINTATHLTVLEDLYLPFKKSRKTKAEKARQNGLEGLAKMVMAQNTNNLEALALRFVTENVDDTDAALEGARHIIAEWINERTDIRAQLRYQLERYATIITKVIKAKSETETAQKFRDYFDWEERLNRIPSHRLLAILRAEKEGYIRVKIAIDDDRALDKIERRILKSKNDCTTQIEMAIKDAYKRLLLPSLSNTALQEAKEKADDAAIEVFAKNLKQLLLGAPIGQKRVLAIDPGFRTGCKVVCLDAQGKFLHNATIYPHAPKNDSESAIKKITNLVEAHNIEAIAIGNGTASRETEALVKRANLKKEIQIFIVSEAGASIYSASSIAREEFPNHDVTVRGAISIGRRLQDPLAELVKIEAKSIGVGQYQHDVDQTKLKKQLDTVVEHCVNAVGVNVNTASKSLLSYVSGIGPKLAENIFKYREANGIFKSRNAITKVPRLGGKAYQQSAGFLRVKQSKNPLDDSAVHPEHYNIVKAMAKDTGASVDAIIGQKNLLKQVDLKRYCNEEVGRLTLEDIVKELEKPGLDIRAKAKVFSFNQNLKTITDVVPGQLLPGIVNNITNFGCFVDIGIKESGLVHVSNLSDSFVKDVNAHVQLHQQVTVKVLEVDVSRKRIQLKLQS